jgi:hypothetical protein
VTTIAETELRRKYDAEMPVVKDRKAKRPDLPVLTAGKADERETDHGIIVCNRCRCHDERATWKRDIRNRQGLGETEIPVSTHNPLEWSA